MCGLSPFLLVTHRVTPEGHCCIGANLSRTGIPMRIHFLGAGGKLQGFSPAVGMNSVGAVACVQLPGPDQLLSLCRSLQSEADEV